MAFHVSYNGKTFLVEKGESILDCLLREGQRVSYSCHAGVCHSCIMKMPVGEIPPQSQEGLNNSLKRQGFFLSCRCYPISDCDITQAEPESDFRYMDSNKDSQLLLVGVGPGLASLYKIAKSAIGEKHRGKIILYHIVNNKSDLYMVDELQELAAEYNNFSYRPCLLEEGFSEKIIAGLEADKSSATAYLCGAPEIIEPLREQIFLCGVSPTHIHLDH